MREVSYHQWRSCLSKVKYETRKWASEAAQSVNRNRQEGKVEVYKCQFCSSWHVGGRKGERNG